MSRKSARQERFAKNNPKLVGKEKTEKEESSAPVEDNTPSEESVENVPESIVSEELEEMQLAVASLSKEELGSWSHCMSNHIVDHYGAAVKSCTDGITHGNWTKILECMVTVLGIADPEIWIPEQIAFFTLWSAECIFAAEDSSTSEETTDPNDVDGDGDVDADDVAAVANAAADAADEEE